MRRGIPRGRERVFWAIGAILAVTSPFWTRGELPKLNLFNRESDGYAKVSDISVEYSIQEERRVMYIPPLDLNSQARK